MGESLKGKIIKLRKDGKSFNEIHDILGCAKATIWYHSKNAGINQPINGRTVPGEDEISLFKRLYESGKSMAEICRITKRSKNCVTKYILDKRPIQKTMTTSQSVVSWRKRKKKELVEYKGGKCSVCGYDKCIQALQFHHTDPEKKDFTIGGKSWGFDRLKEEADKCVLLCANCHVELHSGLINLGD